MIAKKFKKQILVCIVILSCIVFFSMTKSEVKAETTDNTTTNSEQDLPVYKHVSGTPQGKVTITTQNDLDKLINSTGTDLSGTDITFSNSDDLVFPQGTYKVTNVVNWLFPETSKGNIDFSDATFLTGAPEFGGTNDRNIYIQFHGNHETSGKPQVLTGLKNYGNTETTLNEDGSINLIKNGCAYVQLINTQNVTFDGWTFINAQPERSHCIDIMGSENITVINCSFEGKGGRAYTEEELNKVGAKFSHPLYSEAVQVDIQTAGAAGLKTFENTLLWSKETDNETSSKNITIDKNRFVGYKGVDADSLIYNRLDHIVDRPYGADVGSHSGSKDAYVNITITNNTLDNTIYVPDNAKGELMLAPIHFWVGNVSKEPVWSEETYNNAVKTYKVTGNKITNYKGKAISDNGVKAVCWEGTNFISYWSDTNIASTSQPQTQPLEQIIVIVLGVVIVAGIAYIIYRRFKNSKS